MASGAGAAAKPWLTEPKYFKRVTISAAAAMKMTSHAAAGVQKGLASSNRMPVEVMGLMHGHRGMGEHAGTFIVTDVFPLPVEGTETAVVNLDPNYLISLSDSLEATRSENFMGWYHSHPFDVAPHSNAFLSGTDVSTQLSWQIAEDRAGNPWLALVVDPLRGIAKGRPEIGAFRCYPTDYTPPKGLAPDGVTWADERARNARWGESCVSYYQLDVDYEMSPTAQALMAVLARDYMWARVLSTTPALEKEARDRVPDRVHRIGELVDASERTISAAVRSRHLGLPGDASGGAAKAAGGGAATAAAIGTALAVGPGLSAQPSPAQEAAVASSELAGLLLRAQVDQAVRRFVFCRCNASRGGAAAPPSGGSSPADPAPGGAPDLRAAVLAAQLERASAGGV